MRGISFSILVSILAAALLTACAGTGVGPGTTRDVQAPMPQVIRAADYVFGQQGIPVDEADELGGRLRSGFFDPHRRWGGLTGGRITCGVDSAGVDFVHGALSIEMEVRVDAQRVSGEEEGTASAWTAFGVWGAGSADVDGDQRDCFLLDGYRSDLAQAIVERVEQRAVR